MKCPVCGHKVRPSKKYPGKYLCDTCRKRFPASAVIPDDTDTRSARSSAHKHGSVSGKKRPAARADIGIAMGSMGSDAAIEAADVVLMDDNILKISSIMRIAGKTLQIVHQNIVFALGVKVLVLILGALGMANMWEAVFADVGVSVIAILNSMRTLKVK